MDVQGIDRVAGSTPPAATAVQTGHLAAFPNPPEGAQAPGHTADETLHNALSQLVGNGANVAVQYRVVSPNEIVTVFKNADTGEVITQFPSESMVLIAQFFNKLAGAVVDRTA